MLSTIGVLLLITSTGGGANDPEEILYYQYFDYCSSGKKIAWARAWTSMLAFLVYVPEGLMYLSLLETPGTSFQLP